MAETYEERQAMVPGYIPPPESTIADEKDLHLDREASLTGFFSATAKAFTSGDNWAAQIAKRVHREAHAPEAQPGYDYRTDLEKHKDQIPGRYQSSFIYADSPEEFQMILSDMRQELHDEDILSRRADGSPVSTFVARGLAGIVDVDTPIAFMSGGLGAASKAARWSMRAARGAVAGGTSTAALQAVANEAGTTGDWADIPLAGFGGMAFGLVGGALSKPAKVIDKRTPYYRGMSREESASIDRGTWTPQEHQFHMYTTRDRKSAEDYVGGYQSKGNAVLREFRLKDGKRIISEKEYQKLRSGMGRSETVPEFQNRLREEGIAGYNTTSVTGVRETRLFTPEDADWTPNTSPEQAANDAFAAARQEFSDTLDEGAPLANRDVRKEAFVADDPYRSVAREQAEIEAAEAAEQAAKEAGQAPKPQTFDINEVDVPHVSVGENMPAGQRASVGASQLSAQGSIADVKHAPSLDMINDATQWARRSGVPKDYFDDNGQLTYKGAVGDTTANGARRFHDVVTRIGLGTDFDRMFKSGSVVAQRLAYDLFENASGIVRNNRSGAMLRDLFEKQMNGAFLPQYQDSFARWARDQGVGRWKQTFDPAVRERFNQDLIAELNARAYDGPSEVNGVSVRNVHAAIRDAADAHDRWSELEVQIMQGRPGEYAVHGSEKLKPYSGYFSQKWAGSKMSRLIQAGRYSENDVRDAIAEGYTRMHGVPLTDAKVWAAAVVRRARATDRGTDMNLVGILQQDGRGYLEELLKDAGHTPKEVNKLIDRLTGAVAQRGQMAHTKGRMDIDLRFTASNGIRIMDLMETDVARIVSRRSRGSAGAAALARKGIRSRADRNAVIDAILHEQQAKGGSRATGDLTTDFLDADRHLTRDELEALFSYFDAGPIAGGLSPVYSRIKKLTNLALLNQLGLTQMAETGVQIAAVGWDRWLLHAGDAFRSMLDNKDSPLARELKHMNVMVAEERLFRDDFAIEMDRSGTAQSEFMQRFDHLLNTGQRVQGYISGFYMARKFQQRVAVSSATDKIMQNMKGLSNDLSLVRAKDLGLDPDTWDRIKKYVDDGTVEFMDGHVYKLNFDKWDADIVEDFALALNRHTYQVVQKAMVGESNVWFHKDGLASLFFHLKTFPMLAMQKQAYRNARIADTESMYGFLLGLATAGAAYTVKQAANGRTDNLTPSEIAKGAFGLSNMAGWLPMWTDPVAAMFGMDSLKFNTYAQGIDNNVFSAPAAYTTLNRMANIPGTLVKASPAGMLVSDGISNSDIRALQATPIIGNAYGFTTIFNAIKE